jgi:periplasmic divalent cation tolerance protein
MSQEILLALSTFPDAETARKISNQLVTEKFAACANILPAVESIYRWKEKIESGNETLVLFKLSENRQSAFQEKLRSLHPYEVPEIIVVPISSGLPEYLHWVTENCS